MHSYNRTTKDTNFRYHIVHSQQMLQSYYSLTDYCTFFITTEVICIWTITQRRNSAIDKEMRSKFQTFEKYLVVKHHDTISFALKYCTVYMYLFDMRKIFIQNLWVGVCTNKPLNHV